MWQWLRSLFAPDSHFVVASDGLYIAGLDSGCRYGWCTSINSAWLFDSEDEAILFCAAHSITCDDVNIIEIP